MSKILINEVVRVCKEYDINSIQLKEIIIENDFKINENIFGKIKSYFSRKQNSQEDKNPERTIKGSASAFFTSPGMQVLLSDNVLFNIISRIYELNIILESLKQSYRDPTTQKYGNVVELNNINKAIDRLTIIKVYFTKRILPMLTEDNAFRLKEENVIEKLKNINSFSFNSDETLFSRSSNNNTKSEDYKNKLKFELLAMTLEELVAVIKENYSNINKMSVIKLAAGISRNTNGSSKEIRKTIISLFNEVNNELNEDFFNSLLHYCKEYKQTLERNDIQ